MIARIDVAGANSVLQWNAPMPARCACTRGRVRRTGSLIGHLHCYGSIVRQVVRPIDIARLQCTFDEQATKTRAVDVQVGLQSIAFLEYDLVDEAVLALCHATD